MARLLFVLALLLPLSVLSADRPRALVFCHEDQDSYPWVLKDRPGLNIHIMKLLERELALPIVLTSLPWRRCLAELASGRVDGAFASSFQQVRLEMGHYPSVDGRPDPNKRLHTSSYSLYRRKGDDLAWDGKQFRNLRGPIGILSSFSIGDVLRSNGAEVDEGSKSPEDTLRKLVAGRVQGVALQTSRVERLLVQQPELGETIERAPVPLQEKSYYLMLSFKFVAAYPVLADAVWERLARLRESDEYKRIEQAFYASD